MPQTQIPAKVLDPDGFLAGRFVSPHTRYSVAVDPGSERMLTDSRGNTFLHRESDPVLAQFEQSGLRPHEISDAMERFSGTFSGLPEGVNPVTRIAVYDPEAQALAGDWDDEKRKAVERKLWLETENHPGDLAFVLTPRANPPWPSYGSDSPDEIVELQKRLQIPAGQIRRYEEENERREQVIAAMWEIEADEDKPEKPIVEVGA